MIIKQIKLTNFRQFKGEHVIQFSTDKDKNVSVVLGSNTSGKTTIVSAFTWCLYGINNLKSPNYLLNNILANNLTPNGIQEVSVEVTIEHDNKEYIILRTQKFSKTWTGDSVRGNTPELKVSYIESTGETQPVPPANYEEVINSILPQDLADYFFFDGERIKSINSKSSVVNAVRGLMGLDVYIAGIKHFNPQSSVSVISKLSRELDTGKDTDADRRKGAIEELKHRLEGYENKTPEIEEQIDYFTKKKDEYAQIIRDNQDVRKAQLDKERLEREEIYLQNQIDKSEERLLNDFNSNAMKFFALPLIKKGISIIQSAKEEGEGIPNMHASSIDYILKRGVCICGCDLTKNQGAVEHIQHEQSLLPPQHIGTAVRVFRKDMENALASSEMYANNVKSDYTTWLDSQRELEFKTKELKDISEKIKGFNDVRKIEEKYQDAVNQLERYQQAKQGNHDGILELKTRITEQEKEIEKLVVVSDKNTKIKRYIQYAEAVYEWFKQYYDNEEQKIKDELLASINDNFQKMYHGSRQVKMDDNYKIALTVDNVELAKSEGLETVTNFAFIMGLVELARKRANNANDDDPDNQKVTEPYPIVMDAPFSNTDEKHIENITARLPEVAEQVIMFVMDKDWNYAKKELEKHLGSMYVIEKVDNKDNLSTLRREI